jgi:CCR4-NOT complex subunit CAF16
MSKKIMSGTTNGEEAKSAPSIDVKSLSYAFPDGSSGLRDVILNLPPGSRTLLIGGELSPLTGK